MYQATISTKDQCPSCQFIYSFYFLDVWQAKNLHKYAVWMTQLYNPKENLWLSLFHLNIKNTKNILELIKFHLFLSIKLRYLNKIFINFISQFMKISTKCLMADDLDSHVNFQNLNNLSYYPIHSAQKFHFATGNWRLSIFCHISDCSGWIKTSSGIAPDKRE